MTLLLFTLSAANFALFAWLAYVSVQRSRTEGSARLRSVALVTAAVSVAFMLGAIQRMALQAVRAGWLPEGTTDVLLSDWQAVQSLAALGIGIFAAMTLHRVWGPLANAERMVEVLTERVAPTDVPLDELTPREREVLEAIASGILTDRDLAEALFISPSTARTHVKNMLRKTGLTNRRELMLVGVSQSNG